MPPFSVNTHRYDPYKAFNFKIVWDGQTVAGVNKIGILKRVTEVIKFREGGDPTSSRKFAGKTEFEAIMIEQGVTHDVAFEQWANKVWNYGGATGGQGSSLKDFRKNITIELYNEAGQKVMAYNVYRAWVSEFNALPEMDANGNAVAIRSMKLENEGWERDYAVIEPTEPSFTEPVL
ncbi:MAG: phage tail protein [Saprospiraceae bacterium]|nr:phage tail protein [Saprospiraceae bacterium]